MLRRRTVNQPKAKQGGDNSNSTSDKEMEQNNVYILRQELESIRQSLQDSMYEKFELQNEIKKYEKAIEERNMHVFLQLTDMVYAIEFHIESTVNTKRCFQLRKRKLKEKLRFLCRIRNQLKYLQTILHVENTVKEQEQLKTMLGRRAMSEKDIRSYYV